MVGLGHMVSIKTIYGIKIYCSTFCVLLSNKNYFSHFKFHQLQLITYFSFLSIKNNQKEKKISHEKFM